MSENILTIIAWIFAVPFALLVLLTLALLISSLIKAFRDDWKFASLLLLAGIIVLGGIWSIFYLI